MRTYILGGVKNGCNEKEPKGMRWEPAGSVHELQICPCSSSYNLDNIWNVINECKNNWTDAQTEVSVNEDIWHKPEKGGHSTDIYITHPSPLPLISVGRDSFKCHLCGMRIACLWFQAPRTVVEVGTFGSWNCVDGACCNGGCLCCPEGVKLTCAKVPTEQQSVVWNAVHINIASYHSITRVGDTECGAGKTVSMWAGGMGWEGAKQDMRREAMARKFFRAQHSGIPNMVPRSTCWVDLASQLEFLPVWNPETSGRLPSDRSVLEKFLAPLLWFQPPWCHPIWSISPAPALMMPPTLSMEGPLNTVKSVYEKLPVCNLCMPCLPHSVHEKI